MNSRQLEVFWAVMTTGSVTDAAKLLHVSAPAVSRVLTHLEQSIGFPLFDRTKGRLYPTAESRGLMRAVDRVHDGIHQVEALVHDMAQRKHGLLSIASSLGIGQELVPRAIAAVHQRLPNLRIRFIRLGHEALKQQILEGHSDIGISTLPMEHPQFISQVIAQSALVCVCARDHPLTERDRVSADDLKDFALVGYLPDTPMAKRVQALFVACGGKPPSMIEVDSPSAAYTLVRQGVGVALVDQFSLQSYANAYFHVMLVDGSQRIAANLVTMRGCPLSQAATLFIACLKESLRACGLSAEDG